jgi:hypothetical protein
MINLQHEVQKRGFKVAHIKTDSIKIPDATPEIIGFVTEYGKQYGYNFEHEATYDKMCVVNDAVYIAKYKDGKHAGEWAATGTQFAVPYVFKKLFTREEITFKDLCETKAVTSALYLDMNEGLPDVSEYEKTLDYGIKEAAKRGLTINSSEFLGIVKFFISETGCEGIKEDEIEYLRRIVSEGHNYRFVGKVGRFCPIKEGCGGGILLRETTSKTGEKGYAAATGSKGYRWLESEMIRELGKEADIDRSYYDKMVDGAVRAILNYGNFEWFVSDDAYTKENNGICPF